MSLLPSVLRELRDISGVSVSEDASLAPLTTIRTGGKATAIVTVDSAQAASEALAVLGAEKVPFCCMGAGSDLLVADEGYDGVVIRLGDALQRMEVFSGGDGEEQVTVEVPAGVSVPKLAAAVAEAGLAGLEFACGIPGSVGGGVATNAGAYGRALSDVLTELELATADGVKWIEAVDLEWEYRHCRLPEGAVVTAARFALTRDDSAAILERHRSILDMRRSVQPQGVFTFGSTFKNPSGGAAGRLIDAAGLKGERRGGAEISKVHANFVINLGEASTADVLKLMSHIRQRVHETAGVWLEPEVRLLGASFPWESSASDTRHLPLADG